MFHNRNQNYKQFKSAMCCSLIHSKPFGFQAQFCFFFSCFRYEDEEHRGHRDWNNLSLQICIAGSVDSSKQNGSKLFFAQLFDCFLNHFSYCSFQFYCTLFHSLLPCLICIILLYMAVCEVLYKQILHTHLINQYIYLFIHTAL